MLQVTDFEYSNLHEGYDRSKLNPVNYWDGPWIEDIDELGETIMISAIKFNPSDYEKYWKKKSRLPRKAKKYLKKKTP